MAKPGVRTGFLGHPAAPRRHFGGSVVLLWRKLATWVEESRQESSQDTVYEWFQWLAERLQEQPEFDMLAGAHVKHRNWTP